MIRFLLDTNICICLIKRKPIEVVQKLQTLAISEVGMSSITLSEMEYGVSRSARRDQNKLALAKFVTPIEILPYDDLAAKEYGELRSYLESRGTPIGPLDTLIAAHALSLQCTMVTNSEKEFSRVPNLKVANWIG
jgi:tRNA(fMet)-specific endonuclease VapC